MKINLLTDKAKEAFNNSHFKRNTAPKLMSLLFAIIFWIYVMDQVNPEMVKTFPHQQIELEQMADIQSEGLIVVKPKEVFADVTVKGRRSDIINAQSSDVKLFVTLEGIKEGSTKLEIKRKLFRDGINVSDISLNEVVIQAERIVSEEKPVSIRYTGSLPPGMTSEQATSDITSILLEGPRSLVKKVDRVEGTANLTDVMDVQKMKLTVRPVDRSGNEVEGVQVAISEVEGTANVFKVKKVPVKVTFSGSVASGYKLMSMTALPSTVDMTMKSVTSKLPDSLSTGIVNLNGLNASKTINVDLQLPDTLKPLVKAEEQHVAVQLQVEKLISKEIKLPLDKIRLTNVDPGLNGVIRQNDGFVIIKVTDVASNLERINEESLMAYLDCNGLTVGEHKLKLVLELPVTPENVLVVPSTIQVDLVQK